MRKPYMHVAPLAPAADVYLRTTPGHTTWYRAFSLAVMLFAAACSGGAEHPAPAGEGSSNLLSDTREPCRENQKRSGCHIITAQHEGITDCYVGVQVCRGGAFGPCEADIDGGADADADTDADTNAANEPPPATTAEAVVH